MKYTLMKLKGSSTKILLDVNENPALLERKNYKNKIKSQERNMKIPFGFLTLLPLIIAAITGFFQIELGEEIIIGLSIWFWIFFIIWFFKLRDRNKLQGGKINERI